MAEPERPAIMIEVRSTPSSRKIRMPIRSTTRIVAPKPPQLENALLRDNRADKEIDENDDGDAAKRDQFNMGHQRSRPEKRWISHASANRRDHGAEKRNPLHQVAAGVDDALADIGAERHQKGAAAPFRLFEGAEMRFFEQNPEFRADRRELGGNSIGVEFLARLVDQPGARRIETLNVGKIEDRPARTARLGRQGGGPSLDPGAGVQSPVPG